VLSSVASLKHLKSCIACAIHRDHNQHSGSRSVSSVAKRASIALPTLFHIEAGHADPTWATTRDIAAALGVSIGELARLSEQQE
jgi:DNA-binding XRE family transcriptional regulator